MEIKYNKTKNMEKNKTNLEKRKDKNKSNLNIFTSLKR